MISHTFILEEKHYNQHSCPMKNMVEAHWPNVKKINIDYKNKTIEVDNIKLEFTERLQNCLDDWRKYGKMTRGAFTLFQQ